MASCTNIGANRRYADGRRRVARRRERVRHDVDERAHRVCARRATGQLDARSSASARSATAGLPGDADRSARRASAIRRRSPSRRTAAASTSRAPGTARSTSSTAPPAAASVQAWGGVHRGHRRRPEPVRRRARRWSTPQDLAIEGSSLYVASSSAATGGVTALTIGAGGALGQASDVPATRRVRHGNALAVDGCTFSRGLSGANSIVVRGGKVYAATSAGRVVTINRDPGSGRSSAGRPRTPASAPRCRVHDRSRSSPSASRTSPSATKARSTPRFRTTPTVRRGRVLTFDPTGEGLARRAGSDGLREPRCGRRDCTTGRGLGSTTPHLLATPDGQDVYVAGSAVIELDKGAAGTLTPRNDARGCVQTTAVVNSCSAFASLGTPTAVAIAPDGRHVYAISSSGRIVTLRRDSSSPVCAERGRDRAARVRAAAEHPVLRPGRGRADVHARSTRRRSARSARSTTAPRRSSTPRRRARTARPR